MRSQAVSPHEGKVSDPAMEGRRRRSDPNEPPAEARAEIERNIAMARLWRRDSPGLLGWPMLAGRLAEELRDLAARLADHPEATAADLERCQRARVVMDDYAAASEAERDDHRTLVASVQRRHRRASVGCG